MGTTLLNDNLDLLEREQLTKEFIEEYNLEKSASNVIEYFRKYRRLKYKVMFGPQLRTTTKYKLVWVDESHTNNNDSLDSYVEANNEYLEMSKKLKFINDTSLSADESMFMVCHLIEGYSLYKTKDIICCSQCGLEAISNSAYLKLAMGLNIEVLK